MSSIALFSGVVALLAGLLKYGMDAYKQRHSRPGVTVSIGNESIQLPSDCTPNQVAAVVTILKEKAASSNEGL